MSDLDEQYEMQKAHDHFKRYRRFEKKPLAAADLLSRLISRRGFTQDQFNDELQTAWQAVTQKVAGKQFAGKTHATVIKRGALEVLVDSSPAMQQLAFCKTKLLKQLQAALPDSQIKSIRFKVGKLR